MKRRGAGKIGQGRRVRTHTIASSLLLLVACEKAKSNADAGDPVHDSPALDAGDAAGPDATTRGGSDSGGTGSVGGEKNPGGGPPRRRGPCCLPWGSLTRPGTIPEFKSSSMIPPSWAPSPRAEETKGPFLAFRVQVDDAAPRPEPRRRWDARRRHAGRAGRSV